MTQMLTKATDIIKKIIKGENTMNNTWTAVAQTSARFDMITGEKKEYRADRINDSEGRMICVLNDYHDTHEANTRLIEQAPELLAAISHLLNSQGQDDFFQAWIRCKTAVDKVNEAGLPSNI